MQQCKADIYVVLQMSQQRIAALLLCGICVDCGQYLSNSTGSLVTLYARVKGTDKIDTAKMLFEME